MDPSRVEQDHRRPGLYCQNLLLPEGWRRNVRLEFARGRISRIEQNSLPHPGDENHAVVAPGISNLHSHAFQRCMAGLAETRGDDSDSFWTWREVMYRFVERLSPDDLEAIAAMGYVEMLERGFTRVAEFHYLHHRQDGGHYDNIAEMGGRIAAAADLTGIGLTLLPVFYAQGGFGGKALGAAQRRFANDPDSFAKLVAASRQDTAALADAVVGIAPHSLRAVTPFQLTAILPLALSGPVHIHIAEQIGEVEDCLAWSGARPVQWLFDNAPVDGTWSLVHATHMTEHETRLLASSGAVAGLCPMTEGNLGDGLFPLLDFVSAGGRYGVGTDSNVLISLAEELRLLEYGQRLAHRSRNLAALSVGAATGGSLFRAALQGGAQASQGASAIALGQSADLIALNAEHPSMVMRKDDAWLDSFVFAGGSDVIRDVWRAGNKLVTNGRHRHRDLVERRYRTTLEGLLC